MLLGFEGGHAGARTLLKEGDVRFVALSWGGAEPPTTYDDAYARLVWTAHHWQHWLARGRFPDHPWRSYLQRSALTLKGLTYSPTGAVTAAGSTSLPETPGGNRNYDYRYAWIRDATFALWAMYSLGLDWEAVDFFSFIADMAAGDQDLQIMYGIGGERELEEYELDHLPGYANSRPVRIGNAAYSQRQHDVWGALLDSVYLHSKAADHLDNRIWPILDKQVGEALKHWREPDAGIWEVRGEPKHFTSSKIMCWVAVDRGAQARPDGRRGRQGRRVGARRRRDQAGHPGQRRRRARRLHPVLRQYVAGRVVAARAAAALPAARRPAHPRDRDGDPRGAHRRRPGAALQGGGDRRRVQRGGGHLHDLLLLARLGLVRDRRARARPTALREAAVVRRTVGAVRRGDRPAQRPPTRQLPAGVHAPGSDQRRPPRDREGDRRRPRATGPPGSAVTAYTDAARRRGEAWWPAPR